MVANILYISLQENALKRAIWLFVSLMHPYIAYAGFVIEPVNALRFEGQESVPVNRAEASPSLSKEEFELLQKRTPFPRNGLGRVIALGEYKATFVEGQIWVINSNRKFVTKIGDGESFPTIRLEQATTAELPVLMTTATDIGNHGESIYLRIYNLANGQQLGLLGPSSAPKSDISICDVPVLFFIRDDRGSVVGMLEMSIDDEPVFRKPGMKQVLQFTARLMRIRADGIQFLKELRGTREIAIPAMKAKAVDPKAACGEGNGLYEEVARGLIPSDSVIQLIKSPETRGARQTRSK